MCPENCLRTTIFTISTSFFCLNVVVLLFGMHLNKPSLWSLVLAIISIFLILIICIQLNKIGTILLASSLLPLLLFISLQKIQLNENKEFVDEVYASGFQPDIDEMHNSFKCCGKYGPGDYENLRNSSQIPSKLYYMMYSNRDRYQRKLLANKNFNDTHDEHFKGTMPESCCIPEIVDKCEYYKSGCYIIPVNWTVCNLYVWSHTLALIILFGLSLTCAFVYF